MSRFWPKKGATIFDLWAVPLLAAVAGRGMPIPRWAARLHLLSAKDDNCVARRVAYAPSIPSPSQILVVPRFTFARLPRGRSSMAKATGFIRWMAVLAILEPWCAAQAYHVTDLGTFSGGTVSQGQALTDCGHVVGYARFANYNAHGFLWSKHFGLQNMGAIPPQSNFSIAQAVNSSAIVAGYSTYDYPPLLNERAVLWIDGQIKNLGTLPGSDISEATGINDRGEVVGFSVPHAFLWSGQEGMQDLGTLPGGGYSQALAINGRGEVAGLSDAADGNWHGFVWNGHGHGHGEDRHEESMKALSYLPGGNSASANAINNRGQVVGGSGEGYSANFAVLWEQDGSVENLGALPGQGWSSAFAINDHGQVVGWSGFRAFLWSRDKGMQDLNNLIPSDSGWFLSLPTAINARGQITGQGSINGQSHASLLTPSTEAPLGMRVNDFCEDWSGRRGSNP